MKNSVSFGSFVYQQCSYEYKVPDKLSETLPHLGESATQIVLELISMKITNLMEVYQDHHFDMIKIFEILNDVIHSIIIPEDPKLDITHNQEDPSYQRYMESIVDITVKDRHPNFYEMSININHIALLYLDCLNKKCEGDKSLQILSVVSEQGKKLQPDGKYCLTKESLLEIGDITQSLIGEAIKAIKLCKIGTIDESSHQYQEALTRYEYFHASSKG
jgi:hypothetical protein